MTTTPTDDLPPLPSEDIADAIKSCTPADGSPGFDYHAFARTIERLVLRRQARAAQADQCAEVAAALEIRAILEQIKEVAALHPADDMPTPFQSAWQLCCEEIFYRATGQQWHMDEDDGRRNVSGETAGQKIVRAAAQQPAAVVLNPATGDVRFEPEQQSTAQPVALWQFRWLNMDNEQNPAPSLLEWTEVKPWNPNLQTLEKRIEELRAFRYKGKPAYEVRALYTTPTAQPKAPLTESEQQSTAQPVAEAYQRGIVQGMNDVLHNGIDWARAKFGGAPLTAPPRTDAPSLTDEQALLRELWECGAVANWLRVSDDLKARVERALRTASKPTGGKE